MTRGHLLALVSTIASLQAPSIVFAQDRPAIDAEGQRVQDILRRERHLRDMLRRVEERRLVGDCDSVNDAYFYYVRNRFGMEGFSEELVADLQRQMREIAARPCPPTSNRPFIPLADPPPAPPAAAPSPSETAVVPAPPAPTGAAGTPGPDQSDLDDIIDDPDAGTRSQGLAPQERPPVGSVPSPAGEPAAAPPRQPMRLPQPNLPPPRPVPGGGFAPPGSIADSQIQQAFRDAETALRGCAPALLQLAIETLEGQARLATGTPPGSPLSDSDYVRALEELYRMRIPEPCPPETAQQPDANVLWGDYFYVAGGAGESDVPQTGTGVTRGGGAGVVPERDAGFGADKVTTIGVEGALGFGNFSVRGGYSEGDASTLFNVQPITGGFNGAVFGARSPSGSSGIGAGSASLTGTTQVEVSHFNLGGDAAIAQPSPATRVFISFDYYRDERRYGSTLNGIVGTGPAAITFAQVRDQRIVDNGAALGLTFRLDTTRVTDGGLTFRGSITVQGLVLDSSLDSTERNSSNFGPASDRDFTITIEQDDTSFGIAGAANAELGYAVSPGFSIFAGGSVRYRDRTGGVFNPNSGDQVFSQGLTTALIRDDFWSYDARIGLRVALGRR